MDFYDDIADRYDEITGAASRSLAARAFADAFLARYRPASLLDVACGNGLYSLAFASAGVAVTGADLSAPLLDQAARRASDAGLPIRWLHAPMQQLPASLAGPFDAVLCMGNSIPHLLSDADLHAALAGFAARTAHGGHVVVNLLNYARVLAREERVVGIDRHGPMHYVRFYDFLGPDRLRFNILAIDSTADEPTHRLHSTTLRPYRWDELRDALLSRGCDQVEAFAGLRSEPFDPAASDTVTLVARKK